MRRRHALTALASAVVWPQLSFAQQPTPVRRITLILGNSEDDPNGHVRLKLFRDSAGNRLGRTLPSSCSPDEAHAYWSAELCFVNVPIKGQKNDTLHLIVEDLALRFLPSAKVQRFRLALAAKPLDVFFLCHVPSRNLDNAWNATNLQGCEQARQFWTQATSRKEEGVESYKIDTARDLDAFPVPKWPTQSLTNLIEVTFTGRLIDVDNHPGLLRLIGAKQSVS